MWKKSVNCKKEDASKLLFRHGNVDKNQALLLKHYCWCLKSCTTWDVWNPINNGINYLSTGAGFQPSTVSLACQKPLGQNDANTQVTPATWGSHRCLAGTRTANLKPTLRKSCLSFHGSLLVGFCWRRMCHQQLAKFETIGGEDVVIL